MNNLWFLMPTALLLSLYAEIAFSAGYGDSLFDWEPVGLGGGGAMFCPAISGADPNLMMLSSDMSGSFLSNDGGRSWNMVHHLQLRGNTRCRPALHPKNPEIIFAADGWTGRLKLSEDRGKTFRLVPGPSGGLCGEILFDSGMPDRIILGTLRNEVFISHDKGAVWNICEGIKGVPLSFHFDQTSPPEKRRCFAATTAGIWRSDDSGETWSEKNNGLPSKEIVSFCGSSNAEKKSAKLYCSVVSRNKGGKYEGGVFRSSDGGENWESCMGGGINMDVEKADQWADGPVAQYMCVLSADAAPDTVYAFNTSTGFNPPKHNAVWRSDDAGTTWRATFYSDPRWKEYNAEPNWLTANIGQNYQSAGFGWAVCPVDPARVIFTTSGEAYVTHNGGTSWFNGGSAHAGGEKLGADSRWSNQGLVVTTTWHYYVDPFDAARHYICYTDIGFAMSTDAGKTWNWWGKDRWAPWRNTCYELAFDPEVKGKIWGAFSNVHDIPNANIIMGRHKASGPGGVCVSKDQGVSWKQFGHGLPESATTSIVLDPKSSPGARTLYAGVWEKGVYKSTDDGTSWLPINDGLGHPENMRVCKLVLHPSGQLFALITARKVKDVFTDRGVGIYRSKDKGSSWERINASKPLLWPKDFTVDPDNPDIIYVGAADAQGKKEGGLYRTEDGGANWKLLASEGPEHFGAYLDPRRKGWIYMTLTEGAPKCGLYLSKDNGKSFSPVSGIPFSNVQRIEFDPADQNVVFATTFGGSVWKGKMK